MPIIFEEKKRRQQILLGVFFVLFVLGILFGYRQIVKDGKINFSLERLRGTKAEEVQRPLNLEKLFGIKLDRSALEDPRIKKFEINGILPIVVREEELGRTRPFLPSEL